MSPDAAPTRSLDGKRVAVTGGTGSLGQVLVRRLLSNEMGRLEKVIVFSRDEAKQHYMRLEYRHQVTATDEVIYQNAGQLLEFRIGDVRDHVSVCAGLRDADVVINAAAMKQVPTCEYFPQQAVLTNIVGAENLVRAIREERIAATLLIGVSTDKACKPVNVMGMTKAIQERVFLSANLEVRRADIVCVRYGNVLASRGSVIPLFLDQIQRGGPVTITLREMTRFLLSLDQAVDTVFHAVRHARRGEMYVPIVPSARVIDIADVLIDGRHIPIVSTGIRPGEKVNEVLISEEEAWRTVERDGYYVIRPVLPELAGPEEGPVLKEEYSSNRDCLDREALRDLLHRHGLLAPVQSQHR